MNKLLIFLQNGYGVESTYVPSYEHEIFAKSHTCIRLKEMIPENCEVHIRNANPKIGRVASSNFGYDAKYMARCIDEIQPNVVLFCGKEAKAGSRDALAFAAVQPSCVCYAPHPAYRGLGKRSTDFIRNDVLGKLKQIEKGVLS